MIRLQARLLGRALPTKLMYRFGMASKTTPNEPQPSHHGDKTIIVDHHDEDHDDHGDHGHGHGHHAAPYDWRDDHSKNEDYELDILHRGVPDPTTYHYPFQHAARPWNYAFPENYNQKDLTTNFVQVKHIGPIENILRAPQTVLRNDIAHEYDYESEDLDFQPEDFHSQHFRKKGHMWMWVTVALMPLIFWSCEFFLQKFPDEDYWRYQRPPPLNWPDTEDTPDEDTYKLFKSGEFRRLYQAGILVPPFFEIHGRKKIYTKQSGVNQPMEII